MLGSKLSGWRKIASAMWSAPDDPQIYGSLDVDAGPLRAFIAEARAAGHHVTPTHVVGRALAHALACIPDLNVRILGDQAIPRETVDIFFITAVRGGRDLSGVKVERADAKSATAIAAELDARAHTLKAEKDVVFAKTKQLMDTLPRPLLRAAIRFSAFVTGDLARGIRPLALAPSPFGSAMITSVGMFGLPMGFAPLAWMYKVPILLLVGEITDKPVAIDGRVEVRPMLPICATIDHRYADGWHIGQLLARFREYLADPRAFEPAPAPKSSEASAPAHA